VDYETLIGAEHPVRAIWRLLEGLDLSQFCAPIKARENRPGRDATDPRMLLGLWLYGLSEGVNSAREIARLSTEHVAYRWLCGCVSFNHHQPVADPASAPFQYSPTGNLSRLLLASGSPTMSSERFAAFGVATCTGRQEKGIIAPCA
jgi:hypothetical protein